MKSVVKYAHGPGNVAVMDMPEPVPGPEEVKIEVKAAGICGTDIHIYRGERTLALNPPVIIGHEFTGVVAEVGSSVTGWKPGDRVTSETSAHICGKCVYCRTGNYNICPERRVIGYWFNGAFAKYCVVPSRIVHSLADNLDFVPGALAQPLAACVNAVTEKTSISPGSVVVITGPGAIGLLSLQLAKAAGASVILCGTASDMKRLDLGRDLGAGVTVNIQEQDAHKVVSKLTNGEGADVFIECSGSPDAVRMGFDLVRRGGRYAQIGLAGRAFELDFDTVAYKEMTIRGSIGQKWSSWDRALKLLESGLVKAEPLVSDVLPLTEWKTGFTKMETKESVKVVLTPID